MFRFFRHLSGWFAQPRQSLQGRQESERQSVKGFETLNSRVPLITAAESKNTFVRREAILSRSEKVAGYEFSLLCKNLSRRNYNRLHTRLPYDEILLDRLGFFKVSLLLEHRFALINLSLRSLSNPLIERLQPRNTVLVLDVEEGVPASGDVIGSMADLKKRGFAFGSEIVDDTSAEVLSLVTPDFVQVDISAFNGLDLHALVRDLKRGYSEGRSPPRLIASNLKSHDEFQFCMKCGFDYFQGAFVSSRESLRPTSDAMNRLVLLRVLGMVRNDEHLASIAEQLKKEPTMTYKLLRYFNSAALCLTTRISTLTEALLMLGRDKFYRWASLLLFDVNNAGYPERILAECALARARTLELLAGNGDIPDAPDTLFLVGLFSQIDKVLGRPLPELIDQAALPAAVRDALLEKTGIYAEALALIANGEVGADALPEQTLLSLERCGLRYADYANATSEGLAWACEMLTNFGIDRASST